MAEHRHSPFRRPGSIATHVYGCTFLRNMFATLILPGPARRPTPTSAQGPATCPGGGEHLEPRPLPPRTNTSSPRKTRSSGCTHHRFGRSPLTKRTRPDCTASPVSAINPKRRDRSNRTRCHDPASARAPQSLGAIRAAEDPFEQLLVRGRHWGSLPSALRSAGLELLARHESHRTAHTGPPAACPYRSLEGQVGRSRCGPRGQASQS